MGINIKAINRMDKDRGVLEPNNELSSSALFLVLTTALYHVTDSIKVQT